MVADAAEARDEHHPGRHALGQDRASWPARTRHAHMHPVRVASRPPLRSRLKARIHRARLGLRPIGAISQRHGPARSAAAASSCKLFSKRSSRSGSASRNWTCISAWPGTTEGAFGSSSMRPIVHTVRGPAISGKRSWMCVGEPHHRHPGILAPHHARRAGVVLLADQRDPKVADADDGLDDADAQPG